METLSRKRGFIQSKVSKRVVLRNTPVLSFRVDASASRGVDMVNLLDEVAKLPNRNSGKRGGIGSKCVQEAQKQGLWAKTSRKADCFGDGCLTQGAWF